MAGTNLKPGDRVNLPGYPELAGGTIVSHHPERGGYLVLPDDHNEPGGFGYQEIEEVCQLCGDPHDEPLICELAHAKARHRRPRTRWDRILNPDF